VLPDGSAPPGTAAFDVGHGLLGGFGPAVAPREGSRLLALSTGTARNRTDSGFSADYIKGYAIVFPAGFPLPDPGCGPVSLVVAGRDGVALKVTVTVPAGYTSVSFDWKFYTNEYPGSVCTKYADQAVVLVNPAPPGSTLGNVLFNGRGDPVDPDSSGTIEFCAPGSGYPCPRGVSDLTGTEFDPSLPANAGVDGGASGWQTSSFPVTAGAVVEVTFAIWDAGDGTVDSTILIDNWQWVP
jgi:hypothetical protein